MDTSLSGKRVLVTGGNGFFGSRVCDVLMSMDAQVIVPLRQSTHEVEVVDLVNTEKSAGMFSNCKEYGLDYVFHLAGYNGGIKFNSLYPFDIFSINTQMANNVLYGAHLAGAKKVVSVVTSCSYSDYYAPEGIMEEKHFLDGRVNDTVACHGYAKRHLQLASKFVNDQYGLKAVCVCPPTLYGPGDQFHPDRSKVMAALIRKFLEAKQEGLDVVELWGTGNPKREFMYVEDAAKYTVLSLLKYEDCTQPLNLASGQELSIKKLAELIAKVVEYKGRISWDTTKPDGQLRKKLDPTRQINILGTIPLTPLEEGIRKTVNWCIAEKIV